MGNLGETKQINEVVLKMGGYDYVIAGGGGITPGVPIPPGTVNTAAIQDGAVEMEDLNDSVKAKIQKTYNEDDETLHMDFDEAGDDSNNPDEIKEGD